MWGRDKQRAQQALASLPSSPGRSHRFLSADLSLVSGITSAITELAASEPSIDVLANNAGTWFQHRELTIDGNERTLALNHLAYVALTLGLKRQLLAAPSARVINTGSFVFKGARYDPDNLQSEKRFTTNATYAATKLYNVMFTRALAKRWANTDITVNCFSPGFVATDFGRGQGGLLEPVYQLSRRLFAIAPEQGAATLVHLADTPAVEGVTGRYFEKCIARDVSGPAAIERDCEALLDWSIRAVGLDPNHAQENTS